MNQILQQMAECRINQSTPDTAVRIPPRASFLGVPLELRIQIYSYLNHNRQFHIKEKYRCKHFNNYDKAICRSQDQLFPQLCAAPPFSGVHHSDSLCHHSSMKVTSASALHQTCRQIHKEICEFIGPLEYGVTLPLDDGVGHITTPKQLDGSIPAEKIVQLSVCAMSSYLMFDHLQSSLDQLRHCAPFLTALHSVALQLPLPRHKFCVKRKKSGKATGFDPEMTWRDFWAVRHLENIFGNRVTVILDAWIVFRAGKFENASNVDQIVRVKGVVWGSQMRVKKVEKNDSECRIEWRPVVEQEDERWKSYWKNDFMGYGRQACG